MSEARVRWLSICGEEIAPTERPARFTFRCVRRPDRECGALLIAEGAHSAAHGVKRDGQNLNGGRAQWEWDGDRASPTLAPSINCESHCGWHGYIRKGRCVETDGTDSP